MEGMNSVYSVPMFTMEELSTGSRDIELETILTTTGILSVQVHEIDDVRLDALQDFCFERDNSFFQEEVWLQDGHTKRSTWTSKRTGMYNAIPIPTPDYIEDDNMIDMYHATAMEELRDHVTKSSNIFQRALDRILQTHITSNAPSLMNNDYPQENYDSISDVISKSTNLEHFHSYTTTTTESHTSSCDNQAIWTPHTDPSLFLAFVPGHNCGVDEPDDSLVILPDYEGTPLTAQFQPSTIVFMLGSGVEGRLRLPSTLNLKATVHTIQMRPGQSRLWYGMMHSVPPTDTVQQDKELNAPTLQDRNNSMITHQERFLRH